LASPKPSDASTSAPTLAPNTATTSMLNVQTFHFPAFSTESLSAETLEFPVPPSPAMSFSSRYRVESLPPSLPEIKVQERSSVSSYISKAPLGSGFPSGISGVSGLGLPARSEQGFVGTPSPLASSFGVATPAVEESRFAAAQEQSLKEQNAPSATTTPTAAAITTSAPVSSPVADFKNNNYDKNRPNTVYDLEDVYGGI